jgi:hypothetical protein
VAKPTVPQSASLECINTLKPKYQALIAIPSCNESLTLTDVILSLEKNYLKYTDETLIIINVNNRTSANSNDNQETIKWLNALDTKLHIAWLDNTAPPYSYPDKFGVGLARHQAVTAGINMLQKNAPVISLDGDSPVNEDYLQEIFEKCKSPNFKAGHVNFQHQHQGSQEEINAIKLYDTHLHKHRQRLESAGSPHSWYAIGSTIVCTAEAYAKAGGYNVRRMAGEDFYLLQQLSKTGCHIEMIDKAYVYPSNRPSDRVPFGTGRAVNDILTNGQWFTYSQCCYDELKSLLLSVNHNLSNSSEQILSEVSEDVQKYLRDRKFEDTWIKLQQNSRDEKMLLQRFHEWLDAFQTLKLIHHLTDSSYPKEEIIL